MKRYTYTFLKRKPHVRGIRSLIGSGLCVLLIAFNSSAQANTKPLYRYTHISGHTVISDSIPPEYISKGYEVIDSHGNVIRTVAKELSEAEKAKQLADQEELARLEEWDKELLARYSQVSDVESRKERRISGIKNSIESLKLTLKNIANTISYYQAEAAAAERQGEPVSKETVESITRLQRDKIFISNEIARKENEKTQVTERFNRDIERFKLISKP